MSKQQDLAKKFDHTLLKQNAPAADYLAAAEVAVKYQTASLCVPPDRIDLVQASLNGTSVNLCVVVGFPNGTHTTRVKVAEAQDAFQRGADELDMVMNIGKAKEGNWQAVYRDIQAVTTATPLLTKVIIETCFLTNEEIVKACQVAEAAGANFVKTSTGFAESGATADDVALMKASVSDKVKVKASGGIRTLAAVEEMLAAGADRIGLSSTESILSELQ